MIILTLICTLTALALGLATGMTILLVQQQRQRRNLERLQAQLSVFVDTSINVARCVDNLAVGKQNNTQTVASRRWLVAEAQQRALAGTSMEEIAHTLGLHRDELHLLKISA